MPEPAPVTKATLPAMERESFENKEIAQYPGPGQYKTEHSLGQAFRLAKHDCGGTVWLEPPSVGAGLFAGGATTGAGAFKVNEMTWQLCSSICVLSHYFEMNALSLHYFESSITELLQAKYCFTNCKSSFLLFLRRDRRILVFFLS